VSAESVVLIPRCAECEAVWLPADNERWRAYLGRDDLDEVPDVIVYCPECAAREFR
jgi:RNase P subunit RPR2